MFAVMNYLLPLRNMASMHLLRQRQLRRVMWLFSSSESGMGKTTWHSAESQARSDPYVDVTWLG